MESIKTAACGLCIAAAAVGLISYLSPKGSMEKIVSFVLRLFFLASLVFCLSGVSLPNFSQIYPEEALSSGLALTVDEELLMLFTENLEETIARSLGKMLPENGKVKVFAHISEERIINISSIQIALPKGTYFPEAGKEQVKAMLDVELEVIENEG